MPLVRDIEIDPERACVELESVVRRACLDLQRDGIVLGLSGGVDSSVVAALCCRAVGSDKVLAVVMPERDSDPRSVRDARQVSDLLGMRIEERSITPLLARFGIYRLIPFRFVPRTLAAKLFRKAYGYHARKSGESPFADSLEGLGGKRHAAFLARGNAYYRIKHRVRMVELYLVAEKENRLVVGAANKTEWMTGFFVKWGCDHAADVMPLLGLYKTQVFALARFLALPVEVVEKPPAPDLLPGITDEFALGIRYRDLDLILLGMEEGMEVGDIAAELGIDTREVARVKELTDRSRHMRGGVHW